MNNVKSSEAQSGRKRVVVVTGVSGSGRATAMRVLEDLGWYCVDNLPVAVALTVVRLAIEHAPGVKGVALGIDPRERIFFPEWPHFFAELQKAGFPPQILFLDASDEVLARRYSETRRPHPLAEAGLSVAESIRRERLALAEMRERADRFIDTSALTVHELRELITTFVLGAPGLSTMTVALVSFGYKYGLPVGLDLVFDVRFLSNPFFVAELRSLDGLDPKVQQYVLSQKETARFLEEVGRMLAFLLPLYRREGKSYLTIGFGCTGGRHRSPVIVRALRDRLGEQGVDAQVSDHDLDR